MTALVLLLIGMIGVGGAQAGRLPPIPVNGVPSIRASDFLNSIGVTVHIKQGLDTDTAKIVESISYAGIRNIRDDGTDSAQVMAKWIAVHNATGAKFVTLPFSVAGSANVARTIGMWKHLHAAGALLAAEGPNEPNNANVNYQGETSGFNTTFLPVARFQRDLYAAVKADPALAGIPVFNSAGAGGPEPDNVGLQYLTIPTPLPAGVLMPAGTQYADYANVHNYVVGNGSKPLQDNGPWLASDPLLNSRWDGIYGQYGITWRKKFRGYPIRQLGSLPRVTTETGWRTDGVNAISEDGQGKVFLNLFLDAYKRGYKYTFIYMLRDDPRGTGPWGLFHTDWSPKLSGTYLHNLTTILADTSAGKPGSMNYTIPDKPSTMHDLLLRKSNGRYYLAVWNERVNGSDSVTVDLGATFSTVNVYDPTLGASPDRTLANVITVPLTLSDHPVIIEAY